MQKAVNEWEQVNLRAQTALLLSEFYKRFWEEVGDDVVQSINNAFDKEMSICQKRGIITLLPKKDKPTYVLNNLRPVTLLNMDYKITTKVIANRLAKVFPGIISPNQTGYVKNRYIGEKVRLVSDVIDYTKAKQTQDIAPFLDFKKAFAGFNRMGVLTESLGCF